MWVDVFHRPDIRPAQLDNLHAGGLRTASRRLDNPSSTRGTNRVQLHQGRLTTYVVATDGGDLFGNWLFKMSLLLIPLRTGDEHVHQLVLPSTPFSRCAFRPLDICHGVLVCHEASRLVCFPARTISDPMTPERHPFVSGSDRLALLSALLYLVL